MAHIGEEFRLHARRLFGPVQSIAKLMRCAAFLTDILNVRDEDRCRLARQIGCVQRDRDAYPLSGGGQYFAVRGVLEDAAACELVLKFLATDRLTGPHQQVNVLAFKFVERPLRHRLKRFIHIEKAPFMIGDRNTVKGLVAGEAQEFSAANRFVALFGDVGNLVRAAKDTAFCGDKAGLKDLAQHFRRAPLAGQQCAGLARLDTFEHRLDHFGLAIGRVELEDAHPDDAATVREDGRIHHFVGVDPFEIDNIPGIVPDSSCLADQYRQFVKETRTHQHITPLRDITSA